MGPVTTVLERERSYRKPSAIGTSACSPEPPVLERVNRPIRRLASARYALILIADSRVKPSSPNAIPGRSHGW